MAKAMKAMKKTGTAMKAMKKTGTASADRDFVKEGVLRCTRMQKQSAASQMKAAGFEPVKESDIVLTAKKTPNKDALKTLLQGVKNSTPYTVTASANQDTIIIMSQDGKSKAK